MIANAGTPSVFVDLSPLAADGTNGGAARFALALAERLAPRGGIHLLVKPEAAAAVEGPARAGAAVHLLGRDAFEPRRMRRFARRSPLAPLLPDGASLRRLGADILFSPLGTAAFHEPGLRHVAVVHDFQELSHPGFFDEVELRRRAAFRADLARCDRVVAVSRFTRDEAVSRAGIAPEKIDVIPSAVWRREAAGEDDVDGALARHGLTRGEYGIYPANFWPHKNHERLLAALAGAPDVRLVLCGAMAEGRGRAAARAAALGVSGRVTVLPYVPDRELTALVQAARFLVFPSLFEGFGIPVLEAFQLGTPVACSRIPALEELAGDAALLFDPGVPHAIGAALEALWRDSARRERLAGSGRARAGKYSPDEALARWGALLGR